LAEVLRGSAFFRTSALGLGFVFAVVRAQSDALHLSAFVSCNGQKAVRIQP
jgi:hypothetical protein